MVEVTQDVTSLRLFQVRERGKKEKVHFFTLKMQAKELRDSLIGKGQKDAYVELGPDHDNYYRNRQEVGWNRGRHPKKGHKGRSQQRSFWQK